MKLQTLIILFLWIANSASLNAQLSNQWMMGFTGKMDFSNSPPQYSLYGDTISLRQTNAGICDSSGQIAFWTNGAAVFQNDRDTMQNGELFHLPFSLNYTPNGMPINQGAIALPFPGNANLYYLFHSSIEYYSGSTSNYQFRINIYSSLIDMNGNGGLGSVINNSVFLEDSIHLGNISAIKHGNGRDWWLISHEIASSNFCVWLISPLGISAVSKYAVGTNTSGKSIGQFCFSADGQFLAFPISFSGGSFKIEIIEFDRCSGSFGNVVKSDQVLISHDPYTLGCQFSSSGRFLYLTPTGTLHQYDMQAPNFSASRVVIDTYNGTQAPFGAFFNHMLLAPDGKIYCHSPNGNWTLHVINEPNNIGASCNFVQNQFFPSIGSLGISSLPNMPDYELSALAGSTCDTLVGISEPQPTIINPQLQIFYHPEWQTAFINANNVTGTQGTLEIFDVQGKMVHQENIQIVNGYYTRNLNMSGFSEGMYIVNLISSGQRLSEKFVKY